MSAGRRAPRAERGVSLFEFVVVVVIISILLAVGINKLISYQADAERVAMENVAGVLRSALGLKFAELIVENRAAAAAALVDSNPMERLAELPANYLGELDAPDPAGIEGGYWYFDRQGRALVYRVYHAGYFSGEAGGPARVRFAIRLVYDDRNRNGVYDAGLDKIEGLRLTALEPYRWTN